MCHIWERWQLFTLIVNVKGKAGRLTGRSIDRLVILCSEDYKFLFYCINNLDFLEQESKLGLSPSSEKSGITIFERLSRCIVARPINYQSGNQLIEQKPLRKYCRQLQNFVMGNDLKGFLGSSWFMNCEGFTGMHVLTYGIDVMLTNTCFTKTQTKSTNYKICEIKGNCYTRQYITTANIELVKNVLGLWLVCQCHPLIFKYES